MSRPTKFTPGNKGDIYTDSDTGIKYKCLGRLGFCTTSFREPREEYNWEEVHPNEYSQYDLVLHIEARDINEVSDVQVLFPNDVANINTYLTDKIKSGNPVKTLMINEYVYADQLVVEKFESFSVQHLGFMGLISIVYAGVKYANNGLYAYRAMINGDGDIEINGQEFRN